MNKELMINPDSNDWYERFIEYPVRELVRHLRNNGINTEQSCGHDMNIQCQFIGEKDEAIMNVCKLVSDYFRNRNLPVRYNVEIIVQVEEKHMHSILIIDLNPSLKIAEREDYCRLKLKEKLELEK